MNIRLPLISAAALATLAACGSNNQANNAIDEMNVSSDLNATDMNETVTNATDLNATDLNATDLNAGASTSTDNGAGNATANASGNSY